MATETQPPPLNPTLAPTYTYVIAPFPTAIDAPLIAATQSAGYGSGEMGTGESEALSNNGLQPFDAPMSQSAYMLVAAGDSAGLVAAINAANAAYEMNPASISTIYLNVDVPYDAPPEQRTYLLDQRFRIEGTVIIHGNNAILRQTLINRVFLIGLGAEVELHHVNIVGANLIGYSDPIQDGYGAGQVGQGQQSFRWQRPCATWAESSPIYRSHRFCR